MLNLLIHFDFVAAQEKAQKPSLPAYTMNQKRYAQFTPL
jgi:hypothetical protein